MLALDAASGAEFTNWAAKLPKPRAILVVSAHYQKAPATLGTTRTLPLFYDFGGFPRALYQVKWPAPGAPKLAQRVQELMRPLGGVRQDERRGLDHGAWVPLKWMHPKADVPTLELSLPSQDPKALWKLGRALRPLRDKGALILTSGSLTHNLRARRNPHGPVATWAKEFEAWCMQTLAANDVDALMDWQRKAPAAKTNHPTVEHFVPLIVAAAARLPGEAPQYPIHGFDGGHLSRRCVQFG
jgi:4,5-DOPA dioxygenase extradiol